MVRILAGIAIVISIIGVILFYNYLKPGPHEVPATSPLADTSSASLTDRVNSLEEAVTLLDKKVVQTPISPAVNPNNPSSPAPSDIDTRLSKLETEVADLENRLNSPSSSVAPSTKQSPLYIPLGWTGNSTGLDCNNITSQTITINGADYPGYTSMQFEANIAVYQGNGQAFARIMNNDDGTVIQQSQISTASQDYTWVSSNNFTVSNSSKTYVLQLKSLTGYSAQIQNARIKINF